MRSVGRVVACSVLGLLASACIVGSSDQNRAEMFEFVPQPAGQQEAIEAFRSLIGPDPQTLDEATVVPLGKINTSAGPVVFAEFQTIDPDHGRQQCSGSAGPHGGGLGCGPLGQEAPEGFVGPDIALSASGSSGTWSEVELRVGSDVAHLEAVARDGTRYRMEPIAGTAWMEWKTSRGELVITAFDRDGEPVGSVETDAA